MMTWPQRVVPPDAMEMGALAHGPRVLAQTVGIVVGLRSIVAYTSGLDLAVVAVSSGSHAEAMRRQFQAPAEIDPVTGERRRGEWVGERLQLRALEDSASSPSPVAALRGFTSKRTRIGANTHLRSPLYPT